MPATKSKITCDETGGRVVPLVNRNRCEGKADCEVVCPYGVFEIRRLQADERAGLSTWGRFNLLVHGGKQAIVAFPENCHACGLCVKACPEKAIRLVPTQKAR